MIKRALLIVNPASRRGEWLRHEALAAFRMAEVNADCYQTEQPGHGGEIAARMASKYDAVFTLGGDGTADEVIGALAGTGIPVGVLPGGTGNLLSRALGTPGAVRTAVRSLVNGKRFACDLGLVNGERHFVFSLGIGIDARMIEMTSTASKRSIGILAYAISATRLSLFRETFDVTVRVDGEELKRNASMVMIANFGSVLNNLMELGPDIRGNDGMLNLCILSPQTVSDALRVFRKMVTKDFGPDPCMEFRKGRELSISSRPDARVQADGELLGVTPVTVTVRPGVGTLLVATEFPDS